MTYEKAETAAANIGELASSLQNMSSRENTVGSNGLLAISPRQYREYADEWKRSALDANNDQTRALCLKMANVWFHAAVRFEVGLEADVQEAAFGPVGGECD